MSNDLCRVTIEENEYQLSLEESSEEWFDEDAAMEQYYDEK